MQPSGAGRREQAGGEQQRVAGQEEPDQQPGLGEQHDQDADRAERRQQVVRAERVQGEHGVHGPPRSSAHVDRRQNGRSPPPGPARTG